MTPSLSSPSVRADFDAWQRATSGLRMPAYDDLAEPLATDIANHNSNVGAIAAKLTSVHGEVEEALSSLESGDVGDLMKTLSESRGSRAFLLEEVTRAWDEKLRLCDQCLAQFKSELEPAEAKYEAKVESVKADFERIGSGLAAMPAHGTNGETAVAQLDWLARNRSVHTAAAFAAVENAKARIDAATEQKKAATAGKEAARQFVRKTAERLASV